MALQVGPPCGAYPLDAPLSTDGGPVNCIPVPMEPGALQFEVGNPMQPSEFFDADDGGLRPSNLSTAGTELTEFTEVGSSYSTSAAGEVTHPPTTAYRRKGLAPPHHRATAPPRHRTTAPPRHRTTVLTTTITHSLPTTSS